MKCGTCLFSILWDERSPGEGHDNPLQYSCLDNPPGQRSLVGYSLWGQKGSQRFGHDWAAKHKMGIEL